MLVLQHIEALERIIREILSLLLMFTPFDVEPGVTYQIDTSKRIVHNDFIWVIEHFKALEIIRTILGLFSLCPKLTFKQGTKVKFGTCKRR